MASFPFAGLKKQLNKANQYVSERIMTGVEGTKLDNEFQEMENRTDVFNEMVEDLQIKTKEYLQPNPNVRAKMAAVKGISKLSGQAKASTYPQPEGTLGEAMSTYGRKLSDYENTSDFAEALIETGDTLKQMADLKYSLDDTVKQNYLEPLHHTVKRSERGAAPSEEASRPEVRFRLQEEDKGHGRGGQNVGGKICRVIALGTAWHAQPARQLQRRTHLAAVAVCRGPA